MKFSEKIKRLRKMHGLTQEVLSNETGIPLSTIRNIESDKHQPGYAVIQKLAQHEKMGNYAMWLLLGGEIIEPNTSVREEAATYNVKKNNNLLVDIVEMVEQVLKDNDLELQPRKKGELISYIYEQCTKEDKPADLNNVIQLVKMAA